MRVVLALAAGAVSAALSFGAVRTTALAPPPTAPPELAEPRSEPTPAPTRRGVARTCPEDPALVELAAEVREVDLEERLLRAELVRYEGIAVPWPSDGPTVEERERRARETWAPRLPAGVTLGLVAVRLFSSAARIGASSQRGSRSSGHSAATPACSTRRSRRAAIAARP